MRLLPLRVTTILCAAAFDATTFDATLQALLQDARSVGPQADTSQMPAGLLRAARTRGPRQLAPTGQYSAYAVRVPASGVPYVPRTMAPQVGPQAAVHRWPGAMDDSFLPGLDARLDAAADGGEEGHCAELMSLMEAIEQACAKDRAVDACIAAHWGTLDGVIDYEEDAEVDLHGLEPSP